MGHVLQELLLLDDCEIFECDAASQWASAEGRAVLADGNRRGKVFAGQKSTQGQTSGDGLCECDNIGRYPKHLESEDGSGTAKTALNLVEDEGGMVTVGGGTAFSQEFT